MKFLCVACDEVMTRTEVGPMDRGSLSLVFRCSKCSNEVAMLTNPYETQVVGSLGVKLGDAATPAGDGDGSQASKCPFTDVVRSLGLGEEAVSEGLPWTEEASARLENMPDFARPMAKAGIEKFARDRGHAEVDGEILSAAREFFGM